VARSELRDCPVTPPECGCRWLTSGVAMPALIGKNYNFAFSGWRAIFFRLTVIASGLAAPSSAHARAVLPQALLT